MTGRAREILAIALAVLVLVASGIGLRDPWPADEPRFASLARDMAVSGEWLFPRVGGDLYQDKPPVYFWLLAASYALFGDFRGWFLLPSLLASLVTLLLVRDMGTRLAGPRAGLAAALTLAVTVQFLLASRAAQIDATLTCLTTLSLYALLRHLLFGPAWGWYFIGGFAAGLGVITKGVGFLPLLVLLPYALMRRGRWAGLATIERAGWRWGLAPAALLLGIAVWLVPMLIASAGAGELAAYRDEILFQQTVTRYADAWHHVKPWYYFLVEVVPVLWLPWSLLLVWLVPRWRERWQARDARTWLPLAWVILVLVFFSLSAGKRGIYVLPALPALALAAAPLLSGVLARRGVAWASVALGSLLALGGVATLGAQLAGVAAVREALGEAGVLNLAPLVAFACASVLAVALAARLRPLLAWPLALGLLAVTWGFGIAPQMDARRSGRAFTERALARVGPDEELGLVAYKEQFLLYLDRPVVNFGHRRWLEGPQEAYDAAAWLAGQSDRRVLLVIEAGLEPCFRAPGTRVAEAGETSGDRWVLVRGTPAARCIEEGDPRRARTYVRAK